MSSKSYGRFVSFNDQFKIISVILIMVIFWNVSFAYGNRGVQRERGGGVKIGSYGSRNSSLMSGGNSGRGSGLKIGTSSGIANNRLVTPSTTTASISTFASEWEVDSGTAIDSRGRSSSSGSGSRFTDLHIGLVVPYKSFGTRQYTKAVTSVISVLQRKLTLFQRYELKVHLVMKEMTPSPTGDQERIIGGYEVNETQHPYFAQIINKYYTHFICGSTIISVNAVLTASRCAMAPARYLTLKVGSVFFGDGKTYLVADIIKFQYREYFKISLLLTYSNFVFSDSVRPIDLPDTNFNYYNGPVEGAICGFGSTERDEKESTRLLETKVKIISYEHCRQSYIEDNSVGPKSFCAVPVSGDSDACVGDLGGPFVYQGKLLGVIQYDRGCGKQNKATVYTKVAKYIQWIREQIFPAPSRINDARHFGAITYCGNYVCPEISPEILKLSRFNNTNDLMFCTGNCGKFRSLIPESFAVPVCAPNRISDSEFITSARCINITGGVDKFVKLYGKLSNMQVRINKDFCGVNNLQTGQDLIPSQTVADYDVVIIQVQCNNKEVPFQNMTIYPTLPSNETKSDQKGFVIKQVFQSSPNVSFNIVPVKIIAHDACVKKIAGKISFNLTNQMFCVVQPEALETFDIDLCSDKEGAPVVDTKGNLIGIVIWQELCAECKLNVVLAISELVETYHTNKNKKKGCPKNKNCGGNLNSKNPLRDDVADQFKEELEEEKEEEQEMRVDEDDLDEDY